MSAKRNIINQLVSLGYKIPGSQTPEQFENAFSESMLMVILANMQEWKGR